MIKLIIPNTAPLGTVTRVCAQFFRSGRDAPWLSSTAESQVEVLTEMVKNLARAPKHYNSWMRVSAVSVPTFIPYMKVSNLFKMTEF